MTKGKKYRWSAWCYSATASRSITVTVRNDANGTESSASETVGASWIEITGTFTSSVDATTADVLISVEATSGDVYYFDDVSLVQIGAVAEYDGSGVGASRWDDKSGNELHGTVSGATVENAPADADSGLTYEEGTFGTSSANGILKDAGTGSVTCGTYYTCSYTKIGRLVTVNGYVSVSATSSPDGNLRIVLPFTSAQITQYGGMAVGTVVLHEVAYASSVQLAISITEDTAEAEITEFDTGAGFTSVSAADLSSSDVVWFTLQYIT
jgi:hypothetical protein